MEVGYFSLYIAISPVDLVDSHEEALQALPVSNELRAPTPGMSNVSAAVRTCQPSQPHLSTTDSKSMMMHPNASL